ncbi:hypothetical protein AAJP47_07870 [Psychrobacter sp. B38]|uniref:hypothetical protein n=1 Tax=Psychrobacter sp. B38 TaxID=3143538 RepID=UPI00320C78A9
MTKRFTAKAHLFILATSASLASILFATGCQSSIDSDPAHLNQANVSALMPVVSDMSQQALRIQRALANKDFDSITSDIHPTRGVRFSMYAYVRPETDKVFSREQYAQYLQQSKVRFTWGEKDGTGDPLIEPLPTYLDTWVNAAKYNNARISFNEFKINGNSINNLKKIYPDSNVVEFYYKGSDRYDGMDWRVLRLVFNEYQGKRYLVAIINDQWTV